MTATRSTPTPASTTARPPPAATTSCGRTSPRVKRATKPVTTATADTDGCRNSCVIARCGDGVVREGVEGCDDGNNVNTDACLDSCALARCGDGVRRTDLAEGADGFEACDDGNQNNNDSCTNSCAAAPSGSQGNPGRTCNTLRQTGQTENRRYWIDPDGDGGANPLRSPAT